MFERVYGIGGKEVIFGWVKYVVCVRVYVCVGICLLEGLEGGFVCCCVIKVIICLG